MSKRATITTRRSPPDDDEAKENGGTPTENWWTTLPEVLKETAGLIAAVTGILGAITAFLLFANAQGWLPARGQAQTPVATATPPLEEPTAPAMVPDVRGLKMQDAIPLLDEQGVEGKVVCQERDGEAPGLIYDMRPNHGTEVTVGAQVEIFINPPC